MRIHCYTCGKSVSTEVPDDTVLRAIATCPECIARAATEARLMLCAASPDLLTACERVLRAIKWSCTEDRLSTDEQALLLDAAIRKAKGE